MSKQYDDYLLAHKQNVKRAYEWMCSHLNLLQADARTTVNAHDLSKYGTEEYDAYDQHFYSKPASTEEKELADIKFEEAWLHHIHNNKHHWQYWIVQSEEMMGVYPMPEEHIIEMLCDWWSFGFKSGNLYETFDWYQANKNKIILHDATRKRVEEILAACKTELDKTQERA